MSHTDVCAQGICDASEFRCALGVEWFSQAQRPTPDKRGGINGSTQHYT